MENKVNKAYLIIGTNLGKRMENLATARKQIEKEIGSIEALSSVYETEPWGLAHQPAFYNQVVLVHTILSAMQTLTHIHNIEQEMGRVRNEKYGARIIDIDILFFNMEQYNTELLTIPHSRIAERNFVLAPLTEIAGNFIHPVLQQSVYTLLAQCKDPLYAKRLTSL